MCNVILSPSAQFRKKTFKLFLLLTSFKEPSFSIFSCGMFHFHAMQCKRIGNVTWLYALLGGCSGGNIAHSFFPFRSLIHQIWSLHKILFIYLLATRLNVLLLFKIISLHSQLNVSSQLLFALLNFLSFSIRLYVHITLYLLFQCLFVSFHVCNSYLIFYRKKYLTIFYKNEYLARYSER